MFYIDDFVEYWKDHKTGNYRWRMRSGENGSVICIGQREYKKVAWLIKLIDNHFYPIETRLIKKIMPKSSD